MCVCWRGRNRQAGWSPEMVADNSVGPTKAQGGGRGEAGEGREGGGGCCSFGSLPWTDGTLQVAFSTVGPEHECYIAEVSTWPRRLAPERPFQRRR